MVMGGSLFLAGWMSHSQARWRGKTGTKKVQARLQKNGQNITSRGSVRRARAYLVVESSIIFDKVGLVVNSSVNKSSMTNR